MAECRFRPRKTSEEEEKCVASAIPSAILGRKCTARLKVNQNTKSPSLSENLNFRKRMAFSVLGSLRTVPSHSTLAVNSLGLKIVSWNVWLKKVVYRHVFLLLYQYADKENLHPCLKSFQTRVSNTIVFSTRFHWVSKPIHLTRIRYSGWVSAAWIINEFEKSW